MQWLTSRVRRRATGAVSWLKGRRSGISTVVELGGAAVASYGLWVLAAWLGFVAGGVALVAIGTAIDGPSPVAEVDQ